MLNFEDSSNISESNGDAELLRRRAYTWQKLLRVCDRPRGLLISSQFTVAARGEHVKMVEFQKWNRVVTYMMVIRL
jgi:hypothetical protein